MATLKRHFAPATGGPSTASGVSYATSTTPTGEIPIGANKIVRIAPSTATVGIFVRFGPAGTNSANANDVYIPYGSAETFDTGLNVSICIFSEVAGTAQVTVAPQEAGGF